MLTDSFVTIASQGYVIIDSKYRGSLNYGFKLLHIDCYFGIYCIIDFISVGIICINQTSIKTSATKCYMALYEIGQLIDD